MRLSEGRPFSGELAFMVEAFSEKKQLRIQLEKKKLEPGGLGSVQYFIPGRQQCLYHSLTSCRTQGDLSKSEKGGLSSLAFENS
jgi:hypothetical protein